MKKINLNIKTDDLVLGDEVKGKKSWKIAKDYIVMAFNIYQQQPDMRGQPKGMKIEEQRKVYKIFDDIDKMKDGVLELEDDRYEFLKKIFNDINWVGGTKVVVRIADKIEEAGKDLNKEKKDG